LGSARPTESGVAGNTTAPGRSAEGPDGRGLLHPQVQLEIFTDASGSGWGAHLDGKWARGAWSLKERTFHSNVRELLAVERALLTFGNDVRERSVCVRTDNRATLAYINRQGGRVPALNKIATRIWERVFELGCAIQAVHVPGIQNEVADFLSRMHDRSDWKLNPVWWRLLDDEWGPHSIDLFASQLNRQLPRYYSWMYDVEAEATDAFRQSWANENGYANPPFNLIGQVLQKVIRDQAKITIVVPVWKPASW